MNNIVVRLNIDIDLYQNNVSINSSKIREQLIKNNEHEVPEIISNLEKSVNDTIIKNDFKRLHDFMKQSFRGGVSIYNTYVLFYEDISFKIILNMRVSDHGAKPSLVESMENRENRLKSDFTEIENNGVGYSLLDVYLKEHNYGIQIFIGGLGDKDYSKPVNSVEDMQRILDEKISTVVNKYFEKFISELESGEVDDK